MTNQQLSESMNHIPDHFLDVTEKEIKKKKSSKRKWIALAACGCVAVGAGLFPWNQLFSEKESGGFVADLSSLSPYLLAEAKYPETVMHPNGNDYILPNGEIDEEAYFEAYDEWSESVRDRRMKEGTDRLDEFFLSTMPEFLSGTEGENVVYSPLNVYFALSMLAEMTDGNSQAQILTLLGTDDLNTLRSQTKEFWDSTYRNDGIVTSILSNSLWLDDSHTYNETVLDNMADFHKASSFSGEMGSEEYSKALQAWLNAQTGGMLKDQLSGLELDADTVLALASTIYYSASWDDAFRTEDTVSGIFHAPQGDITCDFMTENTHDRYYWSDHFSAISKELEQGGNMWFLLPDEGYTPEELLSEQETIQFLVDGQNWENQKYTEITFNVPKFDISSQIQLEESLTNLGVTDIFDSAEADFSPLTGARNDYFVSTAQHGARVKIDEEGCVGVAYTLVALAESAMPDGSVTFTLDRPFLFCITSDQGIPLYTGIVNQPIS